MKMGDGTTVWGNDKIEYVLFPEVYFKFITELHEKHEDLIRAMVLAKVSIRDGTAFDFLNMLLGTTVSKETPMEIGYAQLLDAIKMRSVNVASQAAIERVAKSFGNHSIFPSRSDPTKPIFDDERRKQ